MPAVCRGGIGAAASAERFLKDGKRLSRESPPLTLRGLVNDVPRIGGGSG